MRVTIEFEANGAAFEGVLALGSLAYVLKQAHRKVLEQCDRPHATVCDAPEEADKLRDSHGNVIGSVRVEREAINDGDDIV